MYDHFKCDNCGQSYKGKFVFTRQGAVECYDCDNQEHVGGIKWENVQGDGDMDEKLLRKMVEEMLLEDIERIYRSESEKDEVYTEQFFNTDGTVKLEMVYFQQNPIDLVIEGQKIAYSALRYLEGNGKVYEERAKKLVDIYKEFRGKKLTEGEVMETWEIYFSEETMELVESSFK